MRHASGLITFFNTKIPSNQKNFTLHHKTITFINPKCQHRHMLNIQTQKTYPEITYETKYFLSSLRGKNLIKNPMFFKNFSIAEVFTKQPTPPKTSAFDFETSAFEIGISNSRPPLQHDAEVFKKLF